ncbi:restriction endonuclease [Kitasatospora sp. MAP5-34]|uniref:restriction endonuclease n=1 Tax=Kitasatospora sp. MAP5-34 TaxID=3035102 RepID=UPI002475D91C|nr:restriction endonuclease [Kitasatospora sp. MAP5-34]
MAIEAVLLESPTMRATVADRVEVLDRVQALALLPDGVHVTTEGVAAYFGVGEKAIYSLVLDNRAELVSNGYTVVTGGRLTSFKEVCQVQSRAKSIALFNRRTVLNVAMLLRDSETARQVRCYLLDAEEAGRRRPVDNPVTEVVDNPPPPESSLDAAVARIAENVIRSVISMAVTPLLNSLVTEVGNNSRKIDAMTDRVDRLERIVLDDEEKALARRRLRLLRALDEGVEESVDELLV